MTSNEFVLIYKNVTGVRFLLNILKFTRIRSDLIKNLVIEALVKDRRTPAWRGFFVFR